MANYPKRAFCYAYFSGNDPDEGLAGWKSGTFLASENQKTVLSQKAP
jgi:hypothetical protein